MSNRLQREASVRLQPCGGHHSLPQPWVDQGAQVSTPSLGVTAGGPLHLKGLRTSVPQTSLGHGAQPERDGATHQPCSGVIGKGGDRHVPGPWLPHKHPNIYPRCALHPAQAEAHAKERRQGPADRRAGWIRKGTWPRWCRRGNQPAAATSFSALGSFGHKSLSDTILLCTGVGWACPGWA